MSKASRSVFVCQACGASAPRWSGQCTSCGGWNTMVEELAKVEKAAGRSRSVTPSAPVALSQVSAANNTQPRISTGFAELDRVLGGETHPGLVRGSVVLLGGEPGVGKSTLVTHVAEHILAQPDAAIMYVSGEESPEQIALRINRIISNDHKKYKSDLAPAERFFFISDTDVDALCATVRDRPPTLLIVDSIQTLVTSDLVGAAGSVGQVRETTARLTSTVKATNVPTIIIGHVTKEGQLAGPKVLEHIVDSVLELKGDHNAELRIVRTLKNRFGPTDEVGVFTMGEQGLVECANPSALFLEQRSADQSGSATACVLEGSRPLLIEVQALAVRSYLSMPRRIGRGVELSRLNVLAAVLEKYTKLPISSYDLYVNLAGGYTTREPALDLAVAVAIASSISGKRIPSQVALVGEVGLLGELRSVTQLTRRTKEAKRHGFTQVISRENARLLGDVLKKLAVI